MSNLTINSNQIGFADEFTYNDASIKYEITKDNKVQMYVEDCARALGVTKTSILKDNIESITVRWDRVYDDLVGIEKIPNVGHFKKLDKEMKQHLRNTMKDMTITESELYLWSFRVDSEQGKAFRTWLATIVLPNLREHGIYVTGMENMSKEEVKRVTDERIEKYILRKYGVGIRKQLTSTIKKVLNPAPYEGYIYANYTNIVYRSVFRMDCKPYMEKLGLQEKDNLRDHITDTDINNLSKAEDFMSNLMLSGVTDEKLLENLMTNWAESLKKTA